MKDAARRAKGSEKTAAKKSANNSGLVWSRDSKCAAAFLGWKFSFRRLAYEIYYLVILAQILLLWRRFTRLCQLANFIFAGLNLPSFSAFIRLNFTQQIEILFLAFLLFYRLFLDTVAVALLGLEKFALALRRFLFQAALAPSLQDNKSRIRLCPQEFLHSLSLTV